MSPLSSRRYTECVDRLNSILGKLSRFLEQEIKPQHTEKPKFTTVDGDHNIVKCGRNTYKHSSNPSGMVEIMIWKDGWKKIICAHDTREASEIILNFEWEVNP